MRAPLPAILVLLVACGGSTAGMAGPTLSGKIADASEEAPAIQSNDILARDALVQKAVVKHVLIAWRELGKSYEGGLDPRAAGRSRPEADQLAVELLRRARAGEEFEALMNKYSEDKGSSQTGRAYDVSAEEKLVFEFKRMSLRLKVGESGLVKSQFGWHIVKRIE
jgi:hypothetical protein